jgi:hypothetical protein
MADAVAAIRLRALSTLVKYMVQVDGVGTRGQGVTEVDKISKNDKKRKDRFVENLEGERTVCIGMIMSNSCEGGLLYIPFPTMPSPVTDQQHFHGIYISSILDAPSCRLHAMVTS